MNVPPENGNRREVDRRVERLEDRVGANERAIAGIEAQVSDVKEDVRAVAPLVLGHSELRNDIQSLIRGDRRLEERLAEIERAEREREEKRQAERKKRQEQEKAEEKMRETRAAELAETRRKERKNAVYGLAAAFVLSTGTIVAAIIASSP